MSYENVQKYFEDSGLGERVKVLVQSCATVELAAQAIGCEAKQIAKTMSFLVGDLPTLVVVAGDRKVDNKKFKSTFKQKAKMIPGNLVDEYVGHDPGGVCPFAVKPDVEIYLDVSLKENNVLYPAAGSANSIVKLSLEELERQSSFKDWVDVCKEV